MSKPVTIFGAQWCPDCRRAKKLFGQYQIPYVWVPIDKDPKAMEEAQSVAGGDRRIPVIVFEDGSVLVEPSSAELKVKLGIIDRASKPFYDVIVVGGGPAGLTAAIYTGRDALSTLIIEEAGLGGQTGLTQVIDNFPGFEKGISGEEFAERLSRQAERFGAEALQGERAANIRRDGQYLVVTSVNNREYIGRSVLIATGSSFRKLNLPGEPELTGSHIHYCATCDGPLYRDKSVLVIGGGNSGFEEGLFLSTIASDVTIVEYEKEAKASKMLQMKVSMRSNMHVFCNHAVTEFVATGKLLTAVKVQDRETGEVKEWEPDGVFVFIGLSPNTDYLPDTIEKDDWGFVKTDRTLETTLKGVFSAGDVRSGSTKQAVSAAGEGTTAALMIRQYLQSIGEAGEHHAIERDITASEIR